MDLFLTFLSAFLGFLFALIAQGLLSRIGRYFQKKRVLPSLKKEIDEIEKKCRTICGKPNTEEICYFNMSIWDGLVSSCIVSNFFKQSYYQELISIYDRVRFLNNNDAVFVSVGKFPQRKQVVQDLMKKIESIKQNSNYISNKV